MMLVNRTTYAITHVVAILVLLKTSLSFEERMLCQSRVVSTKKGCRLCYTLSLVTNKNGNMLCVVRYVLLWYILYCVQHHLL